MVSSKELNPDILMVKDCKPNPPSWNQKANKAFKLAGVAVYGKDFEEALRLFNIAVQEDQNFYAAYANRGFVYKKLGMYPEALADYNKAEAVDPSLATKDGCLYDNMAIIFKKQGIYKKAIQFHGKAVSLSPMNPNIYANRCSTRTLMKNYDLAIVDCKRSLDLDPQNYFALRTYGMTLFFADKEQESIPYLTKAIEIKPSLMLYRTRGASYVLTGNRKQGCEDLYIAFQGGDEEAATWLNLC